MKLVRINNGGQRFIAFGTDEQLQYELGWLPVYELVDDGFGSKHLRATTIWFPSCVRFMAYADFEGPLDCTRAEVEAEYGPFPLDADPETRRPRWSNRNAISTATDRKRMRALFMPIRFRATWIRHWSAP